MRLIRIVLISILMAAWAAPVWAQNGLYGSPDPLQTPAVQPNYTPANTYTPNAPGIDAVPANPSQPAYTSPQMASRPASAYVTPNPSYQSRYGSQMVYQNQAASAAGQPAPTPVMPAPPGPNTQSTVSNFAPGGAAAAPAGGAPAPAGNTQAPKGLSVMSQMLAEQGQAGNQTAGGYLGCGGQISASPVTANPSCGGTSGWLPANEGFCPWYGSVSALVMTRDEPNKVWTSWRSDNPYLQITNTQDCESSWKWGGEVRFGRRFCASRCDPCSDPNAYWAIEATYWTLDRFSGFYQTFNSPDYQVSSCIYFNEVTINGITGDNYFDFANRHDLLRTNEIHNIELSVLYGRWASACGCPWDFAWSVGPRFFRFDESLTFSAETDVYGDTYLRNHIINNLFGCQIGGDIGYNFNSNFRLFVMPKAGIFGNLVTNQCDLYNIDPTGVRTDADMFPTHASASRCSFLMQLDVGAEWFFAKNWSLKAGYRVVAVSGIGLADDQMWPHTWDAGKEIIQDNGDLLLHGGVVTLGFNF
jgi:hypothetical protein